MRGKRIISILCVLTLCLGMTFQVEATGLQEKREQLQDLEKEKAAAEQEKKELSQKLEGIMADMEEISEKIEAKEAELAVKEEELAQAQVDENDQYESMKKRIKYMYENGNVQFIEILLESQTIADFLNKAEYISTISEYDRDMLDEFQAVVEDVEQQEAEIQKEYDEMGDMQDELISKQEEVSTLVSEKEAQISELDSQLGDTNAKLAELEEAAAAAQRKQSESSSGYVPNGGGGSVITGNGTFTHPCPGYTYISSYFGYREQPIPGASTNHKGMDFAAGTGTPIYAAASGTVVFAAYSGNAGNMITINHGNGLTTTYMHCNQIFVSSGQSVGKGQNIATVGSTGNSSGPHLHFQVEQGGVPVNPQNYF